ncbi:MAG: hypothetical protein MZW92_69400 [Comamonadaceae bacterium]|nr:hypothetical protein [Comamonadaceae bacterium]
MFASLPGALIAMREEFEAPRAASAAISRRIQVLQRRAARRRNPQKPSSARFGVRRDAGLRATTEAGSSPRRRCRRTPGGTRASVGSPARGVEIAITAAGRRGHGSGPESAKSSSVAQRSSPATKGDPESNRAAFRDGWFRTQATAVWIDARGMLHLGRPNQGHHQPRRREIAPREVEDRPVAASDRPVEAAAFAVPHRTLGEDVAAAVVAARRHAAATDAELRHFVA